MALSEGIFNPIVGILVKFPGPRERTHRSLQLKLKKRIILTIDRHKISLTTLVMAFCSTPILTGLKVCSDSPEANSSFPFGLGLDWDSASGLSILSDRSRLKYLILFTHVYLGAWTFLKLCECDFFRLSFRLALIKKAIKFRTLSQEFQSWHQGKWLLLIGKTFFYLSNKY